MGSEVMEIQEVLPKGFEFELSADVMDAAEDKGYIRDVLYRKSNIIISAKYGASLLENQLFALILSNSANFINDNGTYRVSVPVAEIRAAFSGNDSSFYQHLRNVAARLGNRQLAIEKDGNFAYYQVIQTVRNRKEKNGEVFLDFTLNTDLSQNNLLIDIADNFTLLSLRTMMSFKNDYSLRLYELLNSRSYTPRNQYDSGHYTIEFDRYELYFLIGVINSEDEKIKGAMISTGKRDYEKMAEMAEDKKKSLLGSWSIFRKRVLEPSIKEINEKTEIYIEDMRTINGGYGGKVKSVVFQTRKKTREEMAAIMGGPEEGQAKELTEDEKLDFYDAMHEYMPDLGRPIQLRELKSVAEAAGYDMERIKKQFYNYMENKDTIEKPIPWLIKAIRENYVINAKKTVRPRTKKSDFCNFPQREIDCEKLEKLLRAN